MRIYLTLLATVTLGAAASGQPARRATPIGRDTLDRLNLRADWNAYIPVSGQRDGLDLIQPVDDQQVYVQTKAGLLVAVDARTGRQQWSHKFAIGFTGSFPVAVNAKYCFAAGVGKLFCFDRYTGTLVLEQNLREAFPHREETPVAGPVANDESVYLQMASGWLVGYRAPPQLRARAADPKAPAGQRNVLDRAAQNLGTSVYTPPPARGGDDYRVRAAPPAPGTGSAGNQATPSISALYSVVPPYQLNRSNPVPSLSILPNTVVPPYKLIPDYMKYTQSTPSISSQSALHWLEEDSSLRAEGDKFKREWRYVTPNRSTTRPLLMDNPNDPTGSRLWVSTVGPEVVALQATKGAGDSAGQVEEIVVGQYPGTPLHPLVGPFAFDKGLVLGFVPLQSGLVLAIELTAGSRAPGRQAAPVVYHWKSPVGGRFSNPPVCGADAVYVSGPRNGCVKLDASTGDVVWRTDPNVDQVLAVNREHVYARDGRGRISIYDVNGRPDPRTKQLRPVAALDAPAFTTAVSNGTTDRVLIGGDNGLVISLRDSAARYAKPSRTAPPAVRPPPPKAAPMNPAPMPPMGE